MERAKFDFELPPQLEAAIDALEEGINNNVSYIDCLQDEIHANARYLDDEEKEQQVIRYYCGRRW